MLISWRYLNCRCSYLSLGPRTDVCAYFDYFVYIEIDKTGIKTAVKLRNIVLLIFLALIYHLSVLCNNGTWFPVYMKILILFGGASSGTTGRRVPRSLASGLDIWETKPGPVQVQVLEGH